MSCLGCSCAVSSSKRVSAMKATVALAHDTVSSVSGTRLNSACATYDGMAVSRKPCARAACESSCASSA